MILLHKYPHMQRMMLNDFGYILEGDEDRAHIYMQNGSLVIVHETYQQVIALLLGDNIKWPLE